VTDQPHRGAGSQRNPDAPPQPVPGTGEKKCPIDGRPVPENPTGRPATYCSSVCRKRADRRRSQAARLLEYADSIEAGIGRPGFGSEKHLRDRAAGIRAQAATLLDGIGPGAPS
jgi:hypothetical protein